MQARDYFKANFAAHTLRYLAQSCFSAICPTKSPNSIFQKYGERKEKVIICLCKQMLIRTTKQRKRLRASHGSPLLMHDDCRSFSFLKFLLFKPHCDTCNFLPSFLLQVYHCFFRNSHGECLPFSLQSGH